MTHTRSRTRLRRLALTAFALAALLVFAGQPVTSNAASPSPWHTIPGAAPPANTAYVLQAVATVSASDVWVVGFTDTTNTSGAHIFATFAEHWNGTSWSVVASPGQSGDSLNAVTVLAASDVWAVGSSKSSNGTFTDHWNGTT